MKDLTPRQAREMRLRAKEGVLVGQVAGGSPAQKAGIEERDVILVYQGHRIWNVGELIRRVALTSPGTAARLELLRGRKRLRIAVTIGERPETCGWLGVVTRNLAPRLFRTTGVLVVEAAEGSPAEKAGIEERDVILAYQGSRIVDVNHLSNKVAQTCPGTAARLELLRNGKRLTITVTIGAGRFQFR